MIYGMKQVLRYLAGNDKAERNFAVRPDDTFLVSYPRSGNTWTRFLIANLFFPHEQVSFANIERLIPDTSSQSSRALKRTPSPRVIKTHQYFDHRYPRVIYIVRDPRDVVLSYYDFQRKYRQIADGYPLESYVADFVEGRIGSSDWGTWAENVVSWVGTRAGQSSFLLLRYEDMVADTTHELTRVSEFLGIQASGDRLREIVDLSSAKRMRQLEARQSDQWIATKSRRTDIPFVRTAATGSWRSLLPSKSVAHIESAWGEVMARVGYESSSLTAKQSVVIR
jgi:hypothetical protein